MRILIIEDDQKIASFLENGYRSAGFVPEVFHRGDDGLDAALTMDFDFAVIDLMLPGLDGLQVIKEMRANGVKIPVIILSARTSVDDRIQGLESGGDDYMIKPFSFGELLARTHVILRRSGTADSKNDSLLSFADLELDPWKREVRRNGESIPLHPREFALLELLMRNPGRYQSKTAVLENVYDYSFDPKTNVVDVLVHRLRKKIDGESDTKLIHTERGVGYALKES